MGLITPTGTTIFLVTVRASSIGHARTLIAQVLQEQGNTTPGALAVTARVRRCAI